MKIKTKRKQKAGEEKDIDRTETAGAPVQHSISLFHASCYHKDTFMQTVNPGARGRGRGQTVDSRHGMNSLIQTEEDPATVQTVQ